ncbi:MAG: metal ABC transporter ATP-binding protein [Candidatus Izemoplasmatales bacterium]
MHIDIHNLSFAYGHKTVIQNLSLSLASGDYLVVNGKNGSGKTTLIKCLLGINPVSSGMIFFDHQDINNFNDWTKFGYVSQRFESLNYGYPITVDEFLYIYSLKRKNQNKRLKLLDKLGILEIVNENINNLSGGQLQRVFIAKAMLNDPSVLIFDEPTASIDKMNTQYFYKTINELHEMGITIILISHNDSLEDMNYTHLLSMHLDQSFTFLPFEKVEKEAQ